MKAKKSLARNKRFLSIIGKLNNSCSNIKTNNDFSNASLEKEYLNTNPSITNNSTLINHDKKINCNLQDVNSNEGIKGNKKNYSFLVKNWYAMISPSSESLILRRNRLDCMLFTAFFIVDNSSGIIITSIFFFSVFFSFSSFILSSK